jgi:asparagine synthase (glutamine-hydrolysing)
MPTQLRSRMRAIAGLCSLTGPLAPESCLSMLRAMSPFRSEIRRTAPGVLLGSSDYCSSPVLSSSASSQGLPEFAADLRLDNYEELVRELGLAQTASDDDVLAHAWKRWAFSIVDHLIGAFAIACWNAQQQTLFLVRDHAGERPLHFVRTMGPSGTFAFASMPTGLCALRSVGHPIDVGAMAHFLAALSLQGTETLFANVERLPPAHWLKLSSAGIEIRRYWHPIHARPIRYRKDEDYIDDFRERFDRAVAVRLTGGDGIASQLSAGLDSSSVTVTAARLLATAGQRLTACTAVPVPDYDGSALHGRFGDEGPTAADVAGMYPNIDHVLVNADGRNLLASSQRDSRLTGQPTFNPTNLLWVEAILDDMRSRGLRVLLQGTGGNATISFGGLIGLSELFRSGHWIRLLRLTHKLRAGGHTSWRGASSWATGWIVPQWMRRLYHPDMRGFSLEFSAVHPQLAAKYHLEEKALTEFYGGESSTASVRRSFYEYFDPGVNNGAAAAGWQIEQRDPTLDKGVFEFCFGIPIEQYLAGGQSRSIIRRAMEGRLPESTLRRTMRGLQAADWYLTVGAARPQLSAELTRIERSPLVRHVLDIARLRVLLDTWPETGYHTSQVNNAWHLALTRGIAAGSFLAQYDPDMPREESPAATTEKPGAVPGF